MTHHGRRSHQPAESACSPAPPSRLRGRRGRSEAACVPAEAARCCRSGEVTLPESLRHSYLLSAAWLPQASRGSADGLEACARRGERLATDTFWLALSSARPVQRAHPQRKAASTRASVQHTQASAGGDAGSGCQAAGGGCQHTHTRYVDTESQTAPLKKEQVETSAWRETGLRKERGGET